MKQLMTKWADNINEKNVLGEYPRPLMRRKSYVNLNGIWKYAIRETKGYPGSVFAGSCIVGGKQTVKTRRISMV